LRGGAFLVKEGLKLIRGWVIIHCDLFYEDTYLGRLLGLLERGRVAISLRQGAVEERGGSSPVRKPDISGGFIDYQPWLELEEDQEEDDREVTGPRTTRPRTERRRRKHDQVQGRRLRRHHLPVVLH